MPLGFIILFLWTAFLGYQAVSILGLQVRPEDDGFYAVMLVALGVGIEAFRRFVAFPFLSRVVGFHLFIPIIDGTWDWALYEVLGEDRPADQEAGAKLAAELTGFAEAYEKDPEFRAAVDLEEYQFRVAQAWVVLEERGVPGDLIEIWLRNPDIAPFIDGWLASHPPVDDRMRHLDDQWLSARRWRDAAVKRWRDAAEEPARRPTKPKRPDAVGR